MVEWRGGVGEVVGRPRGWWCGGGSGGGGGGGVLEKIGLVCFVEGDGIDFGF